MHAQILVAEEMEDLAGRVTDAVLAVFVDRAEQLTDPALRSAVGALIVTAREQLAHAPVQAEPLVWAILRGEPVAQRPAAAAEVLAVDPTADPAAVAVPANTPGTPGTAAPAYWPAVPAISDELFAEYAAKATKEADRHPSGSYLDPSHAEGHTDQPDADDSPAAAPELAADPAPELTTAEDAGPEPKQVHSGRFHGRPMRRRKKARR